MIVVDASAVVEVLLQLGAAERVMERLFDAGDSLHAPELLDIEVAQVLRRYARAGDISSARGAEAVRDLAELPLTRHEHGPLLDRVWQLRNNLTAYDATYVALAEGLDAVLVTRDAALARVPGARLRVEVL